VSADAEDFWNRAVEAMDVARHDLDLSPDAASSRAYYAAFYAVSAHFALTETSFLKHSAIEVAVHRDLVKPGIWETHLGRGYSRLVQLRTRGDYGAGQHVSHEDALEAIQIASKILRKVSELHPDDFDLTPSAPTQ